ncbi:hypothetical protein BDV10DRAFT_112070 [Aspergillus recurvatus]
MLTRTRTTASPQRNTRSGHYLQAGQLFYRLEVICLDRCHRSEEILQLVVATGRGEPVIPQGDDQPSARFTFEGFPIEKQTFDSAITSQERLPQARNLQQTPLEVGSFEQPRLPARPTAKRIDSGIMGIEKNGYRRLPRASTKEDQYEDKSTACE